MELLIADDNGLGLDATLEVEPGAIVLHSRGGTTGSPTARNRDYAKALRLILRRLLENHIEILGAWVDSSRVQNLPFEAREILSPDDFPATYETLFTLMSRRMQAVGRSPDSGSGHGNSNKRIKLSVKTRSAGEIVRAIGAFPQSEGSVTGSRLPAEALRKVTPEHIWQAIEEIFEKGPGDDFGPSTDYDLLTDTGTRLPPKAVFGRAASLALGFPVGPRHFSAGIGSPSFDLLEKAGYRIVAKGPSVDEPEPLSADDKVWAEGSPRLVSHLRRERGHGLSKAKKAEFVRQHGRLFCERCQIDPVQVFGDEYGEACIEVHHHATAVAEMIEGHRTRLEDLQCLCANCHRYIHRFMKHQQVCD